MPADATPVPPTFVDQSTVTVYRAAASDLDVARAAWVSQDAEAHSKEREEGRVGGLIRFLWRNRHTSPFEHGQFTFVVETPLFVAREFMRHRTFSYNEISGRYTILPNRYYLPADDRPLLQSGKVGAYTFGPGSPEQVTLVRETIRENTLSSHAAYERLLAAGVAKEVARDVLPVNTMTTFWATANPRNLMHFLGLRAAEDALYEIRDVARQMEEHFAEAMPLTHQAWSTNGAPPA
ncbi:FAD-dependent thymidylate synthase [Bogoriella caseilytica]|uniref:Flavin-dependent thymidylate synthase n=1 Tax=Bogoriella caseilytica TaxID=56055 RepID=A0A3N2BAC1_9MICO|nr:FAD-dependent thymidylate synthase [Bogoriella caseilytica]ROR72219.1 thymidylate synthase (FAD) [Bogoriella caseilytica]